MTSETPALSSAELGVLAWADREERVRLTTAEIASVLGSARAREVAASLASKGLVSRLSKGVYRVRPIRAAGTRGTGSAVAAAALVMEGSVYYVGGRTAASIHRLTTQRYGSVVDTFVARRRQDRPVGVAQLVFHLLRPELFDFGIERTIVDDVGVMVSDAERTILDLLDRPERFLGFEGARQILHHSLPRLRAAQLVAYACRWPNVSTARRLGVLLEREGVEAATLGPLAEHLRGSHGDAALVPGGSRRGPLHPVFRVILNDGLENSR